MWRGCCRGKGEGICVAERGERKEVRDDEVKEESKDFGTLRPLPSAMNGGIEWE